MKVKDHRIFNLNHQIENPIVNNISVSFWFLVLILFLPNIAKAQPGWIDYTIRYDYTILDVKGKKVSFKKDKEYSVIIDSVLYVSPNIPSDSLKPVELNSDSFDNYISINDLTLKIPKDGKRVKIQIIYKKDTMHLNQATGMGSYFFHSGKGNELQRISDRTLQFLSGYYYFPRWTESAFYNLPKIRGSVKILNANQRNFLIPKELSDSVFSTDGSNKLADKADEWIVNNFTKPNIIIDKKIERTKISKSMLPYRNPTWEGKLYPTKDTNIFVGKVEYTLDTLNVSTGIDVFSIFNKKESTITHWLPIDNIYLFSTAHLYHDIYNAVLYNATIIRDSVPPCNLLCYDRPYQWKYFRSTNEGKTWVEDKALKKLFNKYHFREFEFLDKRYSLGFSLKEKNIGERSQYQQGTYYLLKNMNVIDSLKTPDKVHYNSNYNRYGFSMARDTVHLGVWGSNPYYYNDSPYFKPLIIKNKYKWSFQVIRDTFRSISTSQQRKDTIKEYQNFRLQNNRELVFKNGSGALILKSDIVDNPHEDGVYVIEEGNQIYLLDNNNQITLISFDSGASWYVYPKSLEDRAEYTFLKIDKQNIISFFSSSLMYKVFYKFAPK